MKNNSGKAITIAVATAGIRCGGTHMSIVIATRLKQRGYKVALYEDNVNGTFETIAEEKDCKIIDKNAFSYKGIDYYCYRIPSILSRVILDYDYVVIDSGRLSTIPELDNYTTCNHNIVVCGSKPWENTAFNEIEKIIDRKLLSSFIYCFSFCRNNDTLKKEIKNSISYRFICFPPYSEDPFSDGNFPEIDEYLGLEYMNEEELEEKGIKKFSKIIKRKLGSDKIQEMEEAIREESKTEKVYDAASVYEEYKKQILAERANEIDKEQSSADTGSDHTYDGYTHKEHKETEKKLIYDSSENDGDISFYEKRRDADDRHACRDYEETDKRQTYDRDRNADNKNPNKQTDDSDNIEQSYKDDNHADKSEVYKGYEKDSDRQKEYVYGRHEDNEAGTVADSLNNLRDTVDRHFKQSIHFETDSEKYYDTMWFFKSTIECSEKSADTGFYSPKEFIFYIYPLAYTEERLPVDIAVYVAKAGSEKRKVVCSSGGRKTTSVTIGDFSFNITGRFINGEFIANINLDANSRYEIKDKRNSNNTGSYIPEYFGKKIILSDEETAEIFPASDENTEDGFLPAFAILKNDAEGETKAFIYDAESGLISIPGEDRIIYEYSVYRDNDKFVVKKIS